MSFRLQQGKEFWDLLYEFFLSTAERLTSVLVLLVECVNFTLEASIGSKLVHHTDAL